MSEESMIGYRSKRFSEESMPQAKQQLIFIINPHSGTQSKNRIIEQIKQEISRQRYTYEIVFTQHKGHAIELARQAANEKVYCVVAVGGDGTMNEVARSLVHSSTALGIIPTGSGNGLARHLQIPMDSLAAVRLINQGKKKCIDSCLLNDHPFFCVAGVGFDAYVGQCFDQQKTRGFYTYVRTTLREFLWYAPDEYRLTINGRILNERAFLVSFANASQYGNNAYISPQASIDDGLIDVCVLEPFPTAHTIQLGIKLFNRTLHKSPFMKIHRTKELLVETAGQVPVHLDGEPHGVSNRIHVSINPASLHVLVPA